MRLDKHTKQAILRNIMDDVPKFVTSTAAGKQAIQDALVKAMSLQVRKIYKTNPQALRQDIVEGYQNGFDTSFRVIVGDADLAIVLKPYKQARDARREAHDKIKGIIDGCSTLKQLKTLLPEFEKYMPAEAVPTKNLPAVANVVADLAKLGWPKRAAA